jgi:tetratricopeptide (TPR) repeat protein
MKKKAKARRHAKTRQQAPGKATFRALVISLGLVLITWLVFGQTGRHDFVNYDDRVYVYDNHQIRSGLTPHAIAWVFTHEHAGNWHPLTTISHMLDYQIFKLDAGGHHLTNVFLHTVAVLLLFFLLRQMTGSMWRSAFVAAVFAIHPLRVESVAWVAERKDVLSAVFFMLTLVAYVRYARKPTLGRYVFMAFLLVCGLLSKPMLVTVPFVLLLLDYWPLGRVQTSDVRSPAFARLRRGEQRSEGERGKLERSQRFAVANPSPARRGGSEGKRATSHPALSHSQGERKQVRGSYGLVVRKLVLEKIPLIVLSIPTAVATFLIQEHSTGSIAQLPFLWRIKNAIVSYVTYIWQMVWPVNLAAFYPHPENQLAIWQIALAALFLIAITLLVIAMRRTRPYLLVGWLWYVVMLLPVIGIVQVGLQGHADRYTYLPQIGLYIAITWLVSDLAKSLPYRRQILAGAGAIVVVVLTGCAWKQVTYWKNSETLWTRALAVTQDNDVAHANLGMFLAERGELDEGLSHLQTALVIRSGAVHPHYTLSLALIHCDLGYVLARKGSLTDAINHLQTAVELQPNYADAHYNLGTAFFQKGQTGEAIGEWRKTLSLRPNDAETHTSLGNGLVQMGLVREAMTHYEEALEIAPDFALALNNLAWILSASPDDKVRDGGKAVGLAERAVEYSGDKNAMFMRTLAAAYAEAGRFAEALQTAGRALRITQSENNVAGIRTLQEDIAHLRAKAPLRDENLKSD